MTHSQQSIFNDMPSDAEVESRARELFRDACAHADSYHTLRLGLGRRKALNAGRSRLTPALWLPVAGGAAACCALAFALAWQLPFGSGTPPAPASQPAVAAVAADGAPGDMALEVGSSQMDLVQNLDFYRWLADQHGAPPARNGGTR